MDITNLDKLLLEEIQEVTDLLQQFEYWRGLHDFTEADKIRDNLKEWDSSIHSTRLWYPQFESSKHREERAFNRMRKYNISVYPWSLEDLT